MTLKGWNRAQGASEPMTRDEFDDLVEKHGGPSKSIRTK